MNHNPLQENVHHLYRVKGLGLACAVLHIRAHPDDEDVGLMAYLAHKIGTRIVYWSATRGEALDAISKLYLAPQDNPQERSLVLQVTARNNSEQAVEGLLELETPAGWQATPEQVQLALAEAGATQTIRFSVTVPAGASEDDYTLRYKIRYAGREYAVVLTPVWMGAPGLPALPDSANCIKETFIVAPSIDKRKLKESLDNKLGMYLAQSIPDKSKRSKAMEKYEQLRQAFLADEANTLKGINYQVTAFLFNQALGFNPPTIFVSDILNHGLVADAVHLYLNNIAGVVRVFNAGVQELIQANVNPQVQPLADDHLPFYYSCNADQRRLKLYHQIKGEDHFAAGRCSCGRDYRFHLGRKDLSIAELAATNRWSLDVLAPMFFNDLVSGHIAGKSSALYGLVLNEVLSKVLGKKPIPMLAPENLGAPVNTEEQFDSLMYRYLIGDVGRRT